MPSRTLTGACPACENTGPHTVQPDEPDAAFAHNVAVTCANCGREFAIEVLNLETA